MSDPAEFAKENEREAAAVQARDRQWCSELAKHDVAARAMYPGGIEIEVPTIAEAVETAREARLAEAKWWQEQISAICKAALEKL